MPASIASRLVHMLDHMDPSLPEHRLRLQTLAANANERERVIIQSLLQTPERTVARPVPLPWHDAVVRSDSPKRELTPTELELLRSIPDDPAAVSADQAKLLHRLSVEIVGPSDRLMVSQKWKPLQEFHEKRVERETLESQAALLSTKVDPGRFARSELGQALVDAFADDVAEHYAEKQVRLSPAACRAEAAEVVQRRLDQGEQIRAVHRRKVADAVQKLEDPEFKPKPDPAGAMLLGRQLARRRSADRGGVDVADLLEHTDEGAAV